MPNYYQVIKNPMDLGTIKGESPHRRCLQLQQQDRARQQGSSWVLACATCRAAPTCRKPGASRSTRC